MGVVLGQPAVASVDHRVAGLSFRAIEGRFDRLIAGSRIEALELDRCAVNGAPSPRTRFPLAPGSRGRPRPLPPFHRRRL